MRQIYIEFRGKTSLAAVAKRATTAETSQGGTIQYEQQYGAELWVGTSKREMTVQARWWVLAGDAIVVGFGDPKGLSLPAKMRTASSDCA